MKFYPVILSGGIGSRLWPLSRQSSPKQFAKLVTEYNLFQDTLLRVTNSTLFHPTIIVCNNNHRFQIIESADEINIDLATIILEPQAKNTAAAIALAAFAVHEQNPDGIMLVMPADHYIGNFSKLTDCFYELDNIANQNYLVTFGIVPDKPETGYGYIKKGKKLSVPFYQAEKFVEKPTLDKAKQYISSDKYYWNSGIFCFKAKTFLDNLQKLEANIYQTVNQAFAAKYKDLDFTRIDSEIFAQCPAKSIDYAMMEKANNVVIATLDDFVWSDVGSWTGLSKLNRKDKDHNVLIGDVITYHSNNCYLHSQGRLLTAVGINNLVVVDTDDAVMVLHKDNDQNIKNLITILEKHNRAELIHHKKHFSPWGYTEILAQSHDFSVLRLHFKAHSISSIRVHQHRSATITVLSGKATILSNGITHNLSNGMSFPIKAGQKHQIQNSNALPLEIIEIYSE